MTPYEILELFQAQVARETGLKTLLAPNAIKEAAPVAVIIPAGILQEPAAYADYRECPVTLKLRIIVEAQVEGSSNALKIALDAQWKATQFLQAIPAPILQLADKTPIKNSRIMVKKSADDPTIENPETMTIAYLHDEYQVSLVVPQSLLD